MLLGELEKAKGLVHVLAADLIDHEAHLVRRLSGAALNRCGIRLRFGAHDNRLAGGGFLSRRLASGGLCRRLLLSGSSCGFLTDCHSLLASLLAAGRNASRLLVHCLRASVSAEQARR